MGQGRAGPGEEPGFEERVQGLGEGPRAVGGVQVPLHGGLPWGLLQPPRMALTSSQEIP